MSRMSFYCMCSLFLILCAGSVVINAQEKIGTGGGTEMALVKGGASLAPIILPKDPTMFTKIAANDLAEYIGKIGGVKPKIIEGLPSPVPGHAIWVGFQPELKEIFPGTDFDFKNPEEILIKCDGKNLAILGRDVRDPKIGLIKSGKTQEEKDQYWRGFQFANRDVEGFQFEYGTVNAVYTFIHDQLGVRWLWPGSIGEVLPKNDRLAIKEMEFRFTPQIRSRGGIFCQLALYRESGDPKKESGAWVRRQRLQLDSLYVPANHGFADWYGRFSKTRPELFALQPDGSREYAGNSNHAKICVSNPKVWEQWLSDVDEIIAKSPNRTVFSSAANDNYGSGHCLCDNCKAWDSPLAEKRAFHYQAKGKGGESFVWHYALSDREVNLANTLAGMLKKKYPDKKLFVCTLAYGFSRPAPIKAVPAENVIIVNVANCLADPDLKVPESPKGLTLMQTVFDWAKISKNQVWRPNLGNIANSKSGGPANITDTIKAMKTICPTGIIGIFIDQISLNWANQGPEYYLLAQLGWDYKKNPEDILAEYYSGFGPAAENIRAYFNLLDSSRLAIMKDKRQWLEIYNEDFIAKCRGQLQKAKEAVKNAPAEYADRVAFIQAGFEYLELNTANQALVKEIIAGRDNPEIKKKMKENFSRIEKIVNSFPYAFNSGLIRNPAEGNLAYIHPDADHKAIAEKAALKAKGAEKKRKLYGVPADGGME